MLSYWKMQFSVITIVNYDNIFSIENQFWDTYKVKGGEDRGRSAQKIHSKRSKY